MASHGRGSIQILIFIANRLIICLSILLFYAQVLGHHSVGKSGKIISSALIEFHHEYIADKKNVSSYNFFRAQLFLNLW